MWDGHEGGALALGLCEGNPAFCCHGHRAGFWRHEGWMEQEEKARPWPHVLTFFCLLCPDSGAQPGGVPSAPTGPLGPPGHGQTLGKNEVISVG